MHSPTMMRLVFVQAVFRNGLMQRPDGAAEDLLLRPRRLVYDRRGRAPAYPPASSSRCSFSVRLVLRKSTIVAASTSTLPGAATMVLFLSTSLTEKLQRELLAGGYPESTPAAVVYKATWPEEKIFRCTVGTLHKTVTENGLTKTSLIIVGECMGDKYLRSLLYHPGFTTEFREATE